MQTNSDLALLYKEEVDFKHTDRVSVVVVTFNKYSYVRDLILSFDKLNYNKDLLDIIIVDNASNDGTEEKLKEEFADQITLIQTGANLGGSGGFNTGMKYAIENFDNDYVWLVDNDVVVQCDSLNYLLDTLKQNPQAACVGSLIMQLDQPQIVSEMGSFMDWSAAKVDMQETNHNYNELQSRDERQVDYCAAASLLKTRKSIEDIGYWEEFFIHFDDVDWCLRAKENNYQVFCNPKSIVFHESMEHKQPTWIKYYNIRNLLYLYAEHKPALLPKIFLKFSFGALYYFFHGYLKNSAMVFKAVMDFVFGKKKKQEFEHEHYKSLNSLGVEKLDNAIFVFKSQENLDSFCEKFGFDISRAAEVLVYPEKKGIFSLLGFALKQYAKTLFSSKTVILDGAFESSFMFPLFRSKIVVYPRYMTFV